MKVNSKFSQLLREGLVREQPRWKESGGRVLLLAPHLQTQKKLTETEAHQGVRVAEGYVTWRLLQLRDSKASAHVRVSLSRRSRRCVCATSTCCFARIPPRLQLTAEAQPCLLARAALLRGRFAKGVRCRLEAGTAGGKSVDVQGGSGGGWGGPIVGSSILSCEHQPHSHEMRNLSCDPTYNFCHETH